MAPRVAVRIGAGTARIGKQRTRIRGAITPAVPDARVVLQRRTAAGGWAFVKGHGVTELTNNRSRYAFTTAGGSKVACDDMRAGCASMASDGGDAEF